MSTTTITLPADHTYLASLPDGTRDELVLRADGVAVLTERVGKAVFDGSVDEGWGFLSTNTTGVKRFGAGLIPNKLVQTNSEIAIVFCDRFLPKSNANTYNKIQGVSAASTSFVFYHSGITDSLVNWTAFLAANPVTVIYKLLTPTTRYSADNGTTWSTTDPEAGTSAIPLHEGTNNIWCTDRLSPEVALDYVQDTNKVINELRAAIVASGATS